MEHFVNRRLLLAKEFYSNAIDLCNHSDSVSKMIAIHNFHIAIEITLKAILLRYEIRSEKTLNIDFETMLSDIDRHQAFKDEDKRVPYRQEVRNLNQMRNMVQHHAMEPDQNSIEDWKTITHQFLEKTFLLYFNEEFEYISRVSFIADDLLQGYMRKALSLISQGEYSSAACFIVAAFEYAKISISKLIPRSSSSFHVASTLFHSGMDLREIQEAFKKTHERIDESILYSTVLATGITVAEYGRLREALPIVIVAFMGHPHCQSWHGKEYSKEEVSWACNFVISCIMRWQSQGLSPIVPENLTSGATQFLEGTWPPERGLTPPST